MKATQNLYAFGFSLMDSWLFCLPKIIVIIEYQSSINSLAGKIAQNVKLVSKLKVLSHRMLSVALRCHAAPCGAACHRNATHHIRRERTFRLILTHIRDDQL